MEQTNSILEQYNASVQAYEDKFTGIDDFAKRFGLTDFRLGLNRLKQGVVKVSNTQGTVNKIYLFSSIILKRRFKKFLIKNISILDFIILLVFCCMESNAEI